MGSKLPAGRPALFEVYPDHDSTESMSVQAQLSIRVQVESYIYAYQPPQEDYHQKTNQLVGR